MQPGFCLQVPPATANVNKTLWAWFNHSLTGKEDKIVTMQIHLCQHTGLPEVINSQRTGASAPSSPDCPAVLQTALARPRGASSCINTRVVCRSDAPLLPAVSCYAVTSHWAAPLVHRSCSHCSSTTFDGPLSHVQPIFMQISGLF